jgi:vacuolar-type H+-ATPase subunit H
MKDIITSILQAEEAAKQIVDDANVKATESALSRDSESEDIKAQAVITMGKERKEKLLIAEKEAQDKYEKEYAKAKEQSSALEKAVSKKISVLAQSLVTEITK